MEIKSSFNVPLPLEETWSVLLDIPRIAPLMPGARLINVDEQNNSYDGEILVRLGPMMLNFRGIAKIVEISQPEGRVTLHAAGKEKKGRGGASMDVGFGLVQEPSQTRVDVVSVLKLSGPIAQYGRSASMINDLADHLIGEFAQNLQRELGRTRPPGAVAASGSNELGPTPKPSEARGHVGRPISGLRLGATLVWKRLRRLFRRS
jgi:uncharacterized protein